MGNSDEKVGDGEGTEPPLEDLQEPSTEKDPGEEPKAPESDKESDPSHQAIGIGIVESPQPDDAAQPPHPDAGE